MLLSVSYAVHLIATVIWLGGIAMMALVALPALRMQTIMDNQWIAFQLRLTPLINGSMVLLWITGFIQMTNDEHYDGFLSINGTWAWAMLLKHLLMLIMMVLTIYVQFSVHPTIKRQLLGKQSAKESIGRDIALLRLNLLLALFILILTAIATAV